ncbi:MerR family transcriptional regulator [Bacillus sp. BRMEA1]|uniref:MerR family transcriptional regulator n=1 Tax=Neobacillus endophyticus TaxID=2738405 RepID=UPI0015654154|nr:MerR family transcriptional regulator [Neobacillus endophyticus]NRD80393.1 MerR family transcriptional regulator [Neobacillus endophyticus]
MNTSEVAKLLGVSASTIQRWIKQLSLPMERNERGHYYFNNEDIELLKKIHEQLQNGTLLQDIPPLDDKKKSRKGTVKTADHDQAIESLITKMKELELSIHAKADSVTSYQILQHRREIEDLQSQVTELTRQVTMLEDQLAKLQNSSQQEKPLVLDKGKVKRKKKNFVSSLFGF